MMGWIGMLFMSGNNRRLLKSYEAWLAVQYTILEVMLSNPEVTYMEICDTLEGVFDEIYEGITGVDVKR